MTDKNSKKPAVKKDKQVTAIESRIKEQLQPEILGQLTKVELESLKEIIRVIKDGQLTMKALNIAYNNTLAAIRNKYGFPEDCTIDDQTGVVRSVVDG
jgi:hypothetical protein